MKMVSLQEKIQCIGTLTTDDVSEWEWGFMANIKDTLKRIAPKSPLPFSEKQIDVIEQIYAKHF